MLQTSKRFLKPLNPNQPSSPALVLQPNQFEVIRDRLERYSGIQLDRISQHVLTTGLAQRLAATNMALEQYIQHLTQPGGMNEVRQLVELAVLNHETIFFRNLPHVRALRDVILPQLHRQKLAHTPLRIWSAGCSTGEEPYSLAILALEAFGQPLPRPIEIWATDLSETALTKARVGCYRGRALNNVTPPQLSRYFLPQGTTWKVRDEVRNLVHFERLNLLDPFPKRAHGIDIIFCQNVTIYFPLATFRTLMEHFYALLPDGGYLFLGFSETLWNIYDAFRLIEVEGAFIYTKAKGSPKKPTSPAGSTLVTIPSQPAGPPRGLPPRLAPRVAQATAPQPERKEARVEGASKQPVNQPKEQTDLFQQATALLEAGQAAEALVLLNRLPLHGPQAPQALALVARAHANRGDLDVAVAEARRALELDSLTTEAYLLLGIVYAQQGQLSVAAQNLERARYLEPESALISFHLAETYRQLKRLDVAQREYRNTLRKLAPQPADSLLDGVAVSWVRETCERQLKLLAQKPF